MSPGSLLVGVQAALFPSPVRYDPGTTGPTKSRTSGGWRPRRGLLPPFCCTSRTPEFIVYVWQPDIPDAIVVQVKLEAEYQGVRVPASHAVESNAVHIKVPDTKRPRAGSRVEQLGLVFVASVSNTASGCLWSRGELALNALDRDRSIFQYLGGRAFIIAADLSR